MNLLTLDLPVLRYEGMKSSVSVLKLSIFPQGFFVHSLASDEIMANELTKAGLMHKFL